MLGQLGQLGHRQALVGLSLQAFGAPAVHLNQAVVARLKIADHRARVGGLDVACKGGQRLPLFIQQGRAEQEALQDRAFQGPDVVPGQVLPLQDAHHAVPVDQAELALAVGRIPQQDAVSEHRALGEVPAAVAGQGEDGVLVFRDHRDLLALDAPFTPAISPAKLGQIGQINVCPEHVGIHVSLHLDGNIQAFAPVHPAVPAGRLPRLQEPVRKAGCKIARRRCGPAPRRQQAQKTQKAQKPEEPFRSVHALHGCFSFCLSASSWSRI